MSIRGLVFKLLGLGVLAGSLSAGWLLLDVDQFLQRPLDLGGASRIYVVEPGSSLRAIAQDLWSRRVLEHPGYLVWYARWNGKAKHIKAGEYEIRPGTTPAGLVDLFVRGEVVQRAFTLVEGWTFAQLVAALGADERIVNTLDAEDPTRIMRRLGAPGMHPEGWFYPDTYYFTRGTSDIEILSRAYAAMQAYLKQTWAERADDLPYETPYEALILASIVEKETGRSDERARIAGVFVRRLELGMRLEADPTVIYGLGSRFDGDLRRRDLREKNPYNTYTFKGLTPTPIAMPSAGAIRAALHPEPGDLLYFVGKGDGSHAFSATYEQHRRAVEKYQIRKRRVAAHSDG